MGYVWKSHASTFQLIAAMKLMEYEKSHSFTSEQIDAYKTGIAEIPVFLAECLSEAEKNIDK